MATWYEVGYVAALKDTFQLILVDARGHGHSEKPHDPEAYRTAVMVGDVVAVLDAMHVPKAHFLGYSMGGWIGYGMAKYALERLHSLSIGGASPYTRSPEPYNQRLQRLQGVEVIPALWDAPVSPALHARLLANDPEARIALTKKRRDSPGLEDILPTVRIPWLLYAGEADGAYALMQECRKMIPQVTFVSFPGLNHVETLFHSELVVPHVTRFLHAVRESAQERN
jgi:pimeloyl-ACP methyl ester carboxylesterase